MGYSKNSSNSDNLLDSLIRKNQDSAAELLIVNQELAYENSEKESRAAELLIAKEKLGYENTEKEHRAAELLIANAKLIYENDEKENRAAELIIANEKLIYENTEKEKRAAELLIANEKLLYENKEKESRAAELVIANKELTYQNREKEKKAKALVLANQELIFQNEEKEKRASELVAANRELAFQNTEKEKISAALLIANRELEQLTYIASHDLQEPLRTISNYLLIFEEDYANVLDTEAFVFLRAIDNAAKRMSALVKGLLNFSRLGHEKLLSHVDVKAVIAQAIANLNTMILDSKAVIEVGEMPGMNLYALEFGQLMQNLISNAIKFRKKGIAPHIEIRSQEVDQHWQFSVKDNGIGISAIYFDRIFDIFQRLHTVDEYEGNGIGLANCKKIVALHQGKIWIESTVEKGTTFYFTIPNLSS